MSQNQYRPWGVLDWVLRHVPQKEWSYLGCLGTEKRALSAWSCLQQNGQLLQTKLVQINDKPSRHSDIVKERYDDRLNEFKKSQGNIEDIESVDLFCPHVSIVKLIDEMIESAGGSLVIDISSLPKRFFFPFIRRALHPQNAAHIQNLLITYTIPEKYPPGKLAENFNEWAHLPLFTGASEYSYDTADMLIVGVGFQALGLNEHIKGQQGVPIKMFIPFPAPLTASMRSWNLYRQLSRYADPDLFKVYRAGANDPSDIFDHLLTLSRNGQKKVSLAPFGPKPMSLGMCIFSCLTESEVFYTQPSVYHPDYSIGVSELDGQPEIYGYCLRIEGKDFYTL